MTQKFRQTGQVLANDCISDGIYSMLLQTDRIAEAAAPGQFVSLYCRDASRLLPRPISICEILSEGRLRLVYRVAGEGTREFSALTPGDEIDLVGPNGRGWPVERIREMASGKAEPLRVMLMGGGIGIPPLIGLAEALAGAERAAGTAGTDGVTSDGSTKSKDAGCAGAASIQTIAVLGYRDVTFLTKDMESCAEIHIATEDGSAGTRGNVLDAVRSEALEADIICACGPTPMLRAIRQYALERNIECYLSLEEKMACGIGACLSCVCRSTDIDEHSQVKNKRVCTEGPVLPAGSIVL